MKLRLTKIMTLVIACSWLATSAMAGDLVRADFQSPGGGPGVFDYSGTGESVFTCPDGGFDFLDGEDSDADCDPDPSAQNGNNNSDVSGGGRWHLNVWGASNSRGITFDFSGNGDTAQCADLSAALDAIYGAGKGSTCGCGATTACQYEVWIAADRLFKKGATSQTLGRFDIVVGGPVLRIVYDQPLSICPEEVTHPNDKNWRVLQSGACGSSPGTAMADVIIPPVGGTGQDIVLGKWNLPFKVTAHKVPLPGDGGGGGDKPCRGKKCE